MRGFVLRSGTELINPFKLLERAGIHQNAHVADLGCGSIGHFILPAAQLVGADGKVYAVDIQRTVLEHIEKQAKQHQFFNIETVWGDMDVYGSLRIPDGDLDLCLLVNNLFVSTNRPALVREMARLLKPGGRAVVAEWKPVETIIGPPADHRMGMEQAKEFFNLPHFEFLDEIEVGPAHYGLLYERTGTSIESELA